jgi:hypothetical protein
MCFSLLVLTASSPSREKDQMSLGSALDSASDSNDFSESDLAMLTPTVLPKVAS